MLVRRRLTNILLGNIWVTHCEEYSSVSWQTLSPFVILM